MSIKNLFFSLLFFIPFIVLSQDTLSNSSSLDQVIITASKYPRKQSETGKVVTVINRDQLEKSSGRSVPELLNSVVGTTIIGANNNPGTNQTASIRGSSAGNVLILIDGIPINDPSVLTNYFDLNFLNVDQIERIEVLKGGQSTLYGSDAVSGVINIITRKNGPKKMQGNLTASAGSYETIKTNIGLNGRNEKSSWGIQYGYLSSAGFSSAFDADHTGLFDRDGIRQHSGNLNFQTAVAKNLQANISGNFSRYNTDLDASAFTDERDYTGTNQNYSGGAGLTYNLSDLQVRFNYRYNAVKRDYEDDSIHKSNSFVDYSKSSFKGRTHFAEIYLNKNWKHIELLAGTDFRKNGMEQETFYQYSFGPSASRLDDSIAKMWQFSGYTSALFKNNKGASFELGGRWNQHSEYGNNFTYTVNPSYLINEKVKLFVNLYSAFKTPTLYQLFDPAIGNTNLQAEKSRIAEAGIQLFPSKQFNLRFVYFNRNTKDAIQYIITDPATFEAEYRNVSRQKNSGFEFEAVYQDDLFSINFNSTYTTGSIRSPYDLTGAKLQSDTVINNLYRIPRIAANISASINITKRFTVNPMLRMVDDRLEPIYASDPERLAGYVSADIYSEYKFGKRVKGFADFRNVTNEQYFDLLGYNTRRFNFMAGVIVNW